jgi:hypothetical protein
MEKLVKKTKTILVRLMQFFVLVILDNLAVADNSGKMDISFLDAWLEAQRNSNFLEAENLNIERAQLQHDAIRGLYLPRVDLNAAYVQLDGPVTADALDFNPLSGFATCQ